MAATETNATSKLFDDITGALGVTSSSGEGTNLSKEDMAAITKLIMQILSDPSMRAAMGGDPNANAGTKGGYVDNPIQAGLWGESPGPGPVQWLGGMPPGYNDDVAKRLAKGAITGNIMRGGLGQALGRGVSQGLGGGTLGGLAGGLAQALPWLFSVLK